MGLIYETAYIDAGRLEEILNKGIETKNKKIIDFLKTNIYPLYLEDIEETSGAYEENPEIKEVYEN